MPNISFILKDSLPPFHFLAKLIQALSRAEQTIDLRELIRVIKQEPSTVANILRIANSAAYMSSKDIISIESAAAIMGIFELKSVVLASVIVSKFDTSKCPNFNIKNYWVDSILTAENAINIFKKLNIETKSNDIYCIGLLSNIGLLYLINQFPSILNQLIADATESQNLSFLIEQQFGMHEYTVSEKLLNFWCLPKIFSNSAANMLNLDYQNDTYHLVNTIQTAKNISHNTIDRIDILNNISTDNLTELSEQNYIDVSELSDKNFEKNKILAEALCR